jgi:hypothetical protein
MLLSDSRILFANIFTNGLIPFEEKQNDGSYISKKTKYESLFGSVSLPLILLYQSGSIPISLPANSFLIKVFARTVSGTPTITITDGGEINYSEVISFDTRYVDLIANQPYLNSTTLNITITGGECNIRVELIVNYC